MYDVPVYKGLYLYLLNNVAGLILQESHQKKKVTKYELWMKGFTLEGIHIARLLLRVRAQLFPSMIQELHTECNNLNFFHSLLCRKQT